MLIIKSQHRLSADLTLDQTRGLGQYQARSMLRDCVASPETDYEEQAFAQDATEAD